MKVLFLVSDFNVGGITSSLRNLSNELVSKGHKVAILNLPKAEIKPEWMLEEIDLIELSGIAKLWNLSSESVKKAKGYLKLPLLLLGIIKKVLNRFNLWNKLIFSQYKVSGDYDYAVAFRQEPTSIWLVCNKVDANLKVSFWHSDPDAEDTSSWDGCLDELDVVAGVSNYVCERLRAYHPNVVTKPVYNTFNPDFIKTKASQFDVEYKKTFNIVTVSRIDFKFKRTDLIPQIASKLKALNVDFHWTVVGDGADMAKLKNLIEKYGVMDCISLVGTKSNPYPYIKQADLFILTSAWESYGMVVVESLILNTPVVAGEYPALYEILEDGVNGIIAKNTVDGIFEGIYNVITDNQLYLKIKENCNKYEYSPETAYQQFLKLGE